MRTGAKMLMMRDTQNRHGNRYEGDDMPEMRRGGYRSEMNEEMRMGGYRNEDNEMRRGGYRNEGNEMRYEGGEETEMRRRRDRRGRYMEGEESPEMRNEMRMGDYPESRFRDRRGREHYDNGRFAPMRNQRDEYNNERGDGDYEYEFGDMNVTFPPLYPLPKRGPMGFSTHGIDGRQQEFYRGRASSSEGLDERTAHEWSKKMKNADGSMGAHWTKEQVKPYMNQVGYQGDEIEFWIIMNAMYSDYCKVAKKYGVDRPEYYAEIAKAWLEDKDAVPDKAAAYYECVVRH